MMALKKMSPCLTDVYKMTILVEWGVSGGNAVSDRTRRLLLMKDLIADVFAKTG